MRLYPRYKAKQREALAWLFVSLMRIDLEPPTLTLTHANSDFLRRFMQLIRLGRFASTYDFNLRAWKLTDSKELAFFLNQIQNHIHTQREKNIVNLLLQYLEDPNLKTKAKLEPLVKKHNVYFYIDIR